ncbi:MAG: hypothetical protein U0Q16_10975 [Bryobacteraceae bacterium]
MGSKSKVNVDWVEAKKRCRLNEDDIRMARELGMTPRSAIKNIPNPKDRWKLPVKEWIHELYAKKFPAKYRERVTAVPAWQPQTPIANQPPPADEPEPWVPPADLLSQPAWHDDERRTPPSPDAVNLRKQAHFRRAAEAVAEEWSQHPAVQAISVFGTVAVPLREEEPRHKSQRHWGKVLHECNDIDLGLWVSDLTVLGELRRALAQTLMNLGSEFPGEFGVTPSHFDVYLIEPGTMRYRGRLCDFGTCPKESRMKDACQADGCGAQPFLRQFSDWGFLQMQFLADPHVKLFDRARGGLVKPEYPEPVPNDEDDIVYF